MTVQERMERNVERLPWSGCWIWMGYIQTHGYGLIGVGRRAVRAHRLAWELANNKPVPPGLFVCHSCDIRCCVNPAHLWIGTNSDNLLDARLKGRAFQFTHNRKKTHCPKGHEYSPENTYIPKGGSRFCKACHQINRVIRRAAVRARH